MWIASVTGYAIPEVPLEIQPLTKQELNLQECKEESCPIVGIYNDDKNLIKIAVSGWWGEGDEDVINSILIHELTHWMQDHSGKYEERTMQNCLIRELEAYVVQNKFLKDIADRDNITIHAPSDLCKNVGS